MTNEAFHYDHRKAASNLRKHGVSFHEATTVFSDQLSSELPDDHHSDEEQRWLRIGMSVTRRILSVVYTDVNRGKRLITARPPTASERRQYEETS